MPAECAALHGASADQHSNTVTDNVWAKSGHVRIADAVILLARPGRNPEVMPMTLRMTGSALLAIALVACSGAIDCTLEPTPAGYWPKACVIQVPEGATVTSTDGGATVVTFDGAVVATYPPCPCPLPDR